MRFILPILLLPLLARADALADARQMHTDDCANARKAGKTCVLNMGDEKVNGTGVTPGGIGVTVIQPTKQPSLIHIRKDFIVEIIKSAEDL